jgi:hypothetical protein
MQCGNGKKSKNKINRERDISLSLKFLSMKYIKLYENIDLFQNWKDSEEYVTPNVSFVEETDTIFYVSKQELYEWVDLGLPSGLKWASCNVGATKPEDFGLYFAWGETQGYSGITDEKQFSWTDYKLCGGSNSTLTKYNNKSSYGTVDNLTTLEQVDDAAYTSDKTCRMPTYDDFIELTANTTSTWETLNGVKGRRFTSKTNGNSIFVPAAGYCSGGSVDNVGSVGFLWSSSLGGFSSRYAWGLYFNSDNVDMSTYYRYFGLTVRAVKSN